MIPGNDDAIRSGTLMCRVIADAVAEGRYMASRKAEVQASRSLLDEDKVAAEQAEARRLALAEAKAREARLAGAPTAPSIANAAPEEIAAAAADQQAGRRRAGRGRRPAPGRRPRPHAQPTRPSPRPVPTPPSTSPTDAAPAAETAAEPPPSTDRTPRPRSPEPPMAEFTAKDVQALRQATGAGMMDAKKALVEADGDFEAAAKKLREKGLAKAATRTDRDNAEGVVAVGDTDAGAAIVQLKSETDFSAKSDDFVALAQDIADAVAADGPAPSTASPARIDDLKVTLKENIELGRVVHVAKARRQGRSTPTSTSRTAGASTASSPCSTAARRAGPRHLDPHRLHQAGVPAPRRGPRGGDRRGARDAHRDHPQGGQARAGAAQDRRGQARRLVPRPGPARAEVRAGREADDREAARRRHDRPLRTGRHRRLSVARPIRQP